MLEGPFRAWAKEAFPQVLGEQNQMEIRIPQLSVWNVATATVIKNIIPPV